jgi:hypothetical protein
MDGWKEGGKWWANTNGRLSFLPIPFFAFSHSQFSAQRQFTKFLDLKLANLSCNQCGRDSQKKTTTSKCEKGEEENNI